MDTFAERLQENPGVLERLRIRVSVPDSGGTPRYARHRGDLAEALSLIDPASPLDDAQVVGADIDFLYDVARRNALRDPVEVRTLTSPTNTAHAVIGDSGLTYSLITQLPEIIARHLGPERAEEIGDGLIVGMPTCNLLMAYEITMPHIGGAFFGISEAHALHGDDTGIPGTWYVGPDGTAEFLYVYFDDAGIPQVDPGEGRFAELIARSASH